MVTRRDHLESVQGRIGFARRSLDERAPAVPPEVVGTSTSKDVVSYEVTIRNARPIVDELSLDREGFTLVHHPLSCVGERDPEVLRDRYLDEVVPFIKDYFKASWVVPRRDGVIIRDRGDAAFPPEPDKTDHGLVRRQVAGHAHMDYSPVAGPMLAALQDQMQGLPIQAYSRLMIIQAWQVLSLPPQDFPLAICDGSTVLDTDLVEEVYDGYGLRHYKLGVHYSPLQRWYYFPNMTPDEFILFKGYDTDDTRSARAAHSAFDNRHASPNAVPRVSIESRYCVYYD
jgi:hypothetical protein